MQKERQSNIELLRIVAMLMVLIIHANYWRIGVPTHAEAVFAPVPTFMRILIQHLASPCVDVFIIISGYFAIRPKLKSIANLWFLLAFWGGAALMYNFWMCGAAFSFHNVCNRVCFPFLGWFISAYLGLYLISPLLNQYADHEEPAKFAIYLIVFFALQTFFDCIYRHWIIDGRGIFNRGYSILSFVPLYLLGRYLRLHRPMWMRSSFRIWFASYAGLFLCAAIIAFACLAAFPTDGLSGKISRFVMKNTIGYTSPICIIGSLSLFLAFDSLSFKSRIVNRISVSVLGVFCFHSMGFYAPIVQSIYRNHSGLVVLILDALFILAVFSIGVVIDRIRILIWNYGSKYVFRQ